MTNKTTVELLDLAWNDVFAVHNGLKKLIKTDVPSDVLKIQLEQLCNRLDGPNDILIDQRNIAEETTKLQHQLQDRLHAAIHAVKLLKNTIELMESDVCSMYQQVTDIIENN